MNLINIVILVLTQLCTTSAIYHKELMEKDLSACSKTNTISLRSGTTGSFIILKANQTFLNWSIPLNCTFRFKTDILNEEEGFIVVLNQYSLRTNPEGCVDYVQVEEVKGRKSRQFCGNFQGRPIIENVTSYIPLTTENSMVWPAKILHVTIFLDTHPINTNLAVSIIPYKRCRADLQSDYISCNNTVANIHSGPDYICANAKADDVIQCPFPECADEKTCYTLGRPEMHPIQIKANNVSDVSNKEVEKTCLILSVCIPNAYMHNVYILGLLMTQVFLMVFMIYIWIAKYMSKAATRRNCRCRRVRRRADVRHCRCCGNLDGQRQRNIVPDDDDSGFYVL